MEGYFLKVINDRDAPVSSWGENTLTRISEWRINESSARSDKLKIPVGRWVRVNKEPNHPGKAFSYAKCRHCLHDDFNDDGERMGDYLCNGCGYSMSVIVKNKFN